MLKEGHEETASEQIRVYPSDYKVLIKEAKKRRTIVAELVHLALITSDVGSTRLYEEI